MVVKKNATEFFVTDKQTEGWIDRHKRIKQSTPFSFGAGGGGYKNKQNEK